MYNPVVRAEMLKAVTDTIEAHSHGKSVHRVYKEYATAKNAFYVAMTTGLSPLEAQQNALKAIGYAS